MQSIKKDKTWFDNIYRDLQISVFTPPLSSPPPKKKEEKGGGEENQVCRNFMQGIKPLLYNFLVEYQYRNHTVLSWKCNRR